MHRCDVYFSQNEAFLKWSFFFLNILSTTFHGWIHCVSQWCVYLYVCVSVSVCPWSRLAVLTAVVRTRLQRQTQHQQQKSSEWLDDWSNINNTVCRRADHCCLLAVQWRILKEEANCTGHVSLQALRNLTNQNSDWSPGSCPFVLLTDFLSPYLEQMSISIRNPRCAPVSPVNRPFAAYREKKRFVPRSHQEHRHWLFHGHFAVVHAHFVISRYSESDLRIITTTK